MSSTFNFKSYPRSCEICSRADPIERLLSLKLLSKSWVMLVTSLAKSSISKSTAVVDYLN
jgi:hypothetical protein